MRYVEGPGLGSCTICWQVCEDGYIDAGPADIVCPGCARKIRDALNEYEVVGARQAEDGGEAEDPKVEDPGIETLKSVANLKNNYRCEKCGEKFDAYFKLNRHKKTCRGGEKSA